MKAVVCELCGSNDVMKTDGYFVCQHCGTKYTLEEARKLMIEGPVDVSGSVIKVDTSAELQNLYTLARRAKDSNNIEDAAKYYEMILLKAPTNWEANFYSICYKAMLYKSNQASSALLSVINCIEPTFLLIKQYISNANERANAVFEVCQKLDEFSDILHLAADAYVSEHCSHLNDRIVEEFERATDLHGKLPKVMCEKLYYVFSDDAEVMSTVGITILKKIINRRIYVEQPNANYIRIIQTYDPSYVAPQKKSIDKPTENTSTHRRRHSTSSDYVSSSPKKQSGCYIATCVYGSYDCPEVWILRRYRDNTLSNTWYGRAFIKMYYAVSPTVVRMFGNNQIIKKCWKKPLDIMVAFLKTNGVSDKPYHDKNW